MIIGEIWQFWHELQSSESHESSERLGLCELSLTSTIGESPLLVTLYVKKILFLHKSACCFWGENLSQSSLYRYRRCLSSCLQSCSESSRLSQGFRLRQSHLFGCHGKVKVPCLLLAHKNTEEMMEIRCVCHFGLKFEVERVFVLGGFLNEGLEINPAGNNVSRPPSYTIDYTFECLLSQSALFPNVSPLLPNPFQT